MRAIDRDLIRGGHYGHRPRVPHSKAEHMAAPTNAANVKKVLANSEPSTHGTSQTNGDEERRSACRRQSGRRVEGVEWRTLTPSGHAAPFFLRCTPKAYSDLL